MAEYIEREALLNALKEERKNGNFVFTSKWIKEIMDNLPTADVVPKSEVEKLQNELVIWKQNRFNLYQKLECYEMARQKVAREIFAEIEKLHLHITNDFDLRRYEQLKKKYTEGEQ